MVSKCTVQFVNFGWIFIVSYLPAYVLCEERLEFSVTKTWDNQPLDHDPVILRLRSDGDDVVLDLEAPFFGDPEPPDQEPGSPFVKLWNYEVVEAFFLGENEKYLEVEFSPHGKHLLLLLAGRKNAIKIDLPVQYRAEILGKRWSGSAKIPKSYFPPHVNLFNAYAIHGTSEKRVYEALYPVPNAHFVSPDFHRLEFFRYVDFTPLKLSNTLSEVWLDALTNNGEAQ
ncbi:UPF0462 protein C4orf33 homolog [Uloborus diversus]|uniref:UPF0462 protein C4orf33 homolog n=1 Tax=Uloborus diversus TaxID=327109 RepID=UPI00240A0F67|nr:UPF0462 protein C4orf33 homolog [Uloborus diversus]